MRTHSACFLEGKLGWFRVTPFRFPKPPKDLKYKLKFRSFEGGFEMHVFPGVGLVKTFPPPQWDWKTWFTYSYNNAISNRESDFRRMMRKGKYHKDNIFTP